MSEKLELSVVIPVCHGGIFLKEALLSLKAIDYQPERFEVLIAVRKEDDESLRIAETDAIKSFRQARFLPCTHANRPKLLNEACSAAIGKILVFGDDDCVFPRDWLNRIKEVFDWTPDLGIIGGRDELAGIGSPFDLALDHVLNSYVGGGNIRRGGPLKLGKYYPRLWNMAVPRDVALTVARDRQGDRFQIFDESLNVHEDVDLAERIEQAGKRVRHCPTVRVGHRRDTTFPAFVRRSFWMAQTSRRLGLQRLPHLTLSIALLGLLIFSAASLILFQLRGPVLALIGAYVAFLSIEAMRGFIKTGRFRVLLLVPCILISLHLSRGIGYLSPSLRWGTK